MQRSTSTPRHSHLKVELRRSVGSGPKSWRSIFIGSWLVAFLVLFILQREHVINFTSFSYDRYVMPPVTFPRLRPHIFNLTDFGAIGDGTVINTKAFKKAVASITAVASDGGGQLNVDAGRWLTAPFNLTSHMTLFLARGAVILAIQDESYWPILPPLPSYGRGREQPGPRYGCFIHGQNLEDVVIAGHNGTIDGQGQGWWEDFREKKSQYTRPCLIQFMRSKNILIADVTLQNSPFWTVHPYDCDNVTVTGVTILAPENSPNTDGVDPDSCRNVLIGDSYISVGDDSVAIKSGWDQFGIAYGRPSANVMIRNVTVHSPVSAGVSIGSEMSGGVTNVTVERLFVWRSRRGVRIKTSPGRGGYVTNVVYRNITLENVRVGILIQTDYGEHPDDNFDPLAYPKVSNISYHGVYGKNVRFPVKISGSKEIPITGVEFKDVNVGVTRKKKDVFQCSFLTGKVVGKILPKPCQDLVKHEISDKKRAAGGIDSTTSQ